MSLVAYENSSESAEDSKEVSSASKVSSTITVNGFKHTKFLPKLTVTSSKEAPSSTADKIAYKNVSFANLPQPSKNKKIIQFSIPLPSDFDSDDENEEQDKKPRVQINLIFRAKRGSGLITLLPQPKEKPVSSTSFIPHSLKMKNDNETVTSTTSFVPNVLRKKKEAAGSDDDDIAIPETFDEEIWQKVCGRPVKTPLKRKIVDTTPKINSDAYFVDSAPPASKPYTGLDNEAFKELIGSNKRKKTQIDIIDINEDDIRSDKEQWLKSLTDPNCEAPTQITNPVDDTRKAKNHITALAQKAIANDKDLQIQWSENKFKRGQTRAKYGF